MKEEIRDFSNLRNFLNLLSHQKFISLSFFLTILILLSIHQSGYYQNLTLKKEEPKVLGSKFSLASPVLYSKNTTGVMAPAITAQSAIVLDLASGLRIYEKNIDDKLLPASTTKIMTAIIAMEYFKNDDVLTVPGYQDEGQDIKLFEGEKMTFENLLSALLIASANDAAETIAANYPGGKTAFIAKMNEKAKTLFLKNTSFTNPIGLDEEGHFTTAFDLAIMAKYALTNPLFAQTVATQSKTLTSVDGLSLHRIDNINILLGKVLGVYGVKTGWTKLAGECLVTYVNRDNKKLIIVVLGSQDRFGETTSLINWTFDNFVWEEPKI